MTERPTTVKSEEAKIALGVHPPNTEDVRRAFRDALTLHKQNGFNRATWNNFVNTVLHDVPEEEREQVLIIMEKRGLIPDTTNNRHVEGLAVDQQNVLGDPDGLVIQSLRLAHSVKTIGKMLGFSDQEIQDVTIATALINTGKAKQYAGLTKDEKTQYDFDLNAKPKAMLAGYQRREQEDYDEIEEAGLPKGVIAILRENIRHDPSQLRSKASQLLYYVLHCQMPDSGKLVPIEDRINDSINYHPLYGRVYEGYALAHDNKDLVKEHQGTVAKIEKEMAASMQMTNATSESFKAHLNTQLGFATPPSPPEPEQ